MSTSPFEMLRATSALSGGNAAFVEELYENYLQDPSAVPDNWRSYFDSIHIVTNGGAVDVAHGPIRESFAQLARQQTAGASSGAGMDTKGAAKQASVLRMINAYRTRGHQAATLDPIQLRERPLVSDLDPTFQKLTATDMDTVFNTGSLAVEKEMKLRDILDVLRTVYTGNIGSEYMHITDTEQKRWIQRRLETTRAELELSADERRQLLSKLMSAEGMEKYLHTRYVGQKRFSLEGGDSLIPMLDELIQVGGTNGAREIVVGMAHRGRLNVLVNIFGKAPQILFEEFEGKAKRRKHASGDVKYHMGFSSDVDTPGGPVHLALAFNPSHLEIVNPVVQGSVRARLERRKLKDADEVISVSDEVLPILIHGDAAFAGQGVIMEGLQMSQVRGYRTGGTVHIVINNQIGFTTSNPLDTRSALYCTDVAKMVQSPIFHVNGDDPEAVLFVTRLAMDYRTRFKKDVVIDLVCYRRLGHNEADEPSATQPMMYAKIKALKTAATLYANRLISEGVVSQADVDGIKKQYKADLDAGRSVARPVGTTQDNEFAKDWAKLLKVDWEAPVDTGVKLETLRELWDVMQKLPPDFKIHPIVAKVVDDRRKMAAGALALNWGFAENMAYATLLKEGYQVRLSGQDCGRGTFSHRHAVLHNMTDGSSHIPLKHLYPDQPTCRVIDSILSEEAVLGFEYGYSTAEPNGLLIWEGQFGDFANGAQVVIDQFIASGETKWDRFCGLVMLLPHGYEGQGPEHSSARLERYLQLCAEKNMQVCVPTTPAQAFHMLRRQVIRKFRKPLIVMTPKSLLRHKLAVNSLEDLTQGAFQEVIGEVDDIPASKVKRVLVCCGKVYYDLLEARREKKIKDIAIIRIEQLYPFPRERYAEELNRYPNANDIAWVQEEPQNQGAWDQIHYRLQRPLQDSKRKLRYVGRHASASTAVGYYGMHVKQQKAFIDAALDKTTPRSGK